eukprot:6309132-Prymnesium_polylepis.1
MSREPALEVGDCPLNRHRPQVRSVTHTHYSASTHTRPRVASPCLLRVPDRCPVRVPRPVGP